MCCSKVLRYLAALIVVLLTGLTSLWVVGNQLSLPAVTQAGTPPTEHVVERVVFEDVHGWYFPAPQHKACMLLMHGVKSSRREMVGRAIFLREAGYSSFAIDLQAHGETPGTKITYGYLESNSARSSVRYLKDVRRCKKVVTIGSSLGGAASLLGPKPIEVDGYILESVYPGIEAAVRNRLRVSLGLLGEFLAPLFYHQIPLRLGIELNNLQPLACIKNIKSPVLIMNGTKDKRTTLEEAQLMYVNAPYPKEFVKFEGASHTNLFNYDPKQYKEAVLSFISTFVDERT